MKLLLSVSISALNAFPFISRSSGDLTPGSFHALMILFSETPKARRTNPALQEGRVFCFEDAMLKYHPVVAKGFI